MNSKLKPMKEGIFEVGPPPKLRGAKCPECNEKFFPKANGLPPLLRGIARYLFVY